MGGGAAKTHKNPSLLRVLMDSRAVTSRSSERGNACIKLCVISWRWSFLSRSPQPSMGCVSAYACFPFSWLLFEWACPSFTAEARGSFQKHRLCLLLESSFTLGRQHSHCEMHRVDSRGSRLAQR